MQKNSKKAIIFLRITLLLLLISLAFYYADVEREISPYYSLSEVAKNMQAYDGKEVALTGKILEADGRKNKAENKVLRARTMLGDGTKLKAYEFELVLSESVEKMLEESETMPEEGDIIDSVAVVEHGKLRAKKIIVYKKGNHALIFASSFMGLLLAFLIFIKAMTGENDKNKNEKSVA